MRILIVDDDLVSRVKLEVILRELADCQVADGGRPGLDAARRAAAEGRPFDLVCLDVNMPDPDGYEVCRRLKADPATGDLAVIFVTSNDDDLDQAKGFSLGAVDYIIKPFSPVVVQARVRNHLELKLHRKHLQQVIQTKTAQVRETQVEILHRLAQAAEFRDFETGRHVKRLGLYCKIIAEGAGFSGHTLELLHQASAMHDVGKIGIPDRILFKPARLSPGEFEVMKTHTTIGAQLLDHHQSELLKTARSIALTHHEQWDGGGYPAGLAQYDIPLEGRIVAICDVFDALTSQRPYKPAWDVDQAGQYVQSQRGRQFDPDLVDVFIRRFDDLTAVRLGLLDAD
jgi:putative two-component system response regulator